MLESRRKGKPRVFIGSSSESRAIAEYIQLGLGEEVEATVWSQGVFGLSEYPLESLEQAAQEFDFAVLVLTPDDVNRKRGRQGSAPRDNVILELGLFIGALGKNRTFIACPAGEPLELPTNLAGTTTAKYVSRENGNIQAALGLACTQIKTEIRKLTGSPGGSPIESRENRPIVARRRRRRSLGTAIAWGPKRTHQIVNISTTGALLQTDGEISLGAAIDLNLELDNGRTARVTAEVVRVQSPAWGLVGGVGVTFTHYRELAEATIVEYVDADPSTS